jgi:hypothetical protein
MALQPFVGPWPIFSSLIFTQSVGFLGRGSASRKTATSTHRTAQTENKRTQASIPQVGFEPTISVFELTKTVHDLDRAATVIFKLSYLEPNQLFP